MPTYGYRCTVCPTTFERFQKISDPPVAECEACGAPVKKILYPVGISFKGSGFYVNDYAGGGGGKSNAESESKSEPKAETKTETKSDSAASTPPSTPAATTGS